MNIPGIREHHTEETCTVVTQICIPDVPGYANCYQHQVQRPKICNVMFKVASVPLTNIILTSAMAAIKKTSAVRF